MARPNKPWFRKSRKQWYVEIDGVQHRLGPDEKKAMRRFHELMALAPERVQQDSLVEMLDAYIAYCHDEKAPATAKSGTKTTSKTSLIISKTRACA